MRGDVAGPSPVQSSAPRHNTAREVASYQYDPDSITYTPNMKIHLVSRPPKRESESSVMDRYSGALETLRNQLWNSNTASNVSFEECASDDGDLVGHMVSRERDLSRLIPIERELCSRGSVFLKRLLINAEKVPLAVLDEVLSDSNVVNKLKSLNDVFSFGKRMHIPKTKIDSSVFTAIEIATKVFNGSTVPTVMWPCTDGSVGHNERVRIDESVVFEALQVYRLRKYNRETYVEWNRSTSMTQQNEGALAMDVTDAGILREISDTILDELSSTMWCLSYLSLHLHSAGMDYIKSYASCILEDHESITATLWNYYLSFSSHMEAMYSHIKDADKSLNDKLGGRMIVEVHRMLTLQCTIVKTLLAIHIGTRSMSVSEYQRYVTHFQKCNFNGVFSVARTIIGVEECGRSLLMMHALYELQAVGTLLLTSFFLYDKFDVSKNYDLHTILSAETIDLMRHQLTAIDSGKHDNRSRPILAFAYACFLQRVSAENRDIKVDSGYITDISRYLDQYSVCFEWLVFSRDMFASTCNDDNVVNFPGRMLLMESLSQLISTFTVKELPRLDSVVNAVCNVVDRSNLQFDCGYISSKKCVLERISEHLMCHFPFGLNILFQLLSAFLPVCVEAHDKGKIDAAGDGESMELIIEFLLSPFKSITVSPINARLEYKYDTCDFELRDDLFIGIQMLYMLGLNKQVLLENWSRWDLGSCLYFLKSGTTGTQVDVDFLKNFSFHVQSHAASEKGDLWLVDAGLSMFTAHSSIDEVWAHDSSMQNMGKSTSNLYGCQFQLESMISVAIDYDMHQSATCESGSLNFTVLRALWLVWHGSIIYMANDTGELPVHALQTFVTCNSLMTSLIKYPRILSLIEGHIMSSMYAKDSRHQSPFGPASIIFNYTLLFLVCLKRPQLRIMLPKVIEALRSFLIPAVVVPVGDNATEVEFSRCWIFFQSLEFCSQVLADENGFHMFTLLHRVMQEEERYLHIYPVTGAILKFFKELLVQCPPELWMLSSWHHGMLNMSHTSLEMESSNLTHGLNLTYLKSLKRYIDGHMSRSVDLYSPFQSLLLCDMFTYVLKNVGLGLGECEFADCNQRFDMVFDIIEIVHLMCRIFRVFNYDNGRSLIANLENADREESWVNGVNELINRILLILSESNYIMEVVNMLGHHLDILHYHNEAAGGSLVMVNPLVFSEASLSFFTVKTLLYRRMGIAMMVSSDATKNHIVQCQTNCKYSWVSTPEMSPLSGQSKRIITTALNLLRDLYVTALPPNRNPLFATLADTLGSNFFVKSRPASEHRRKFLMPSEHIHDLDDPVVYFALRQIGMLCHKLPQVSLVRSLFTHTYSASNTSSATDIVSLHVLLREQSKVKRGSYIEDDISNDRVLLQQLGHLRGHYDVIVSINKDEACFYEHLICMFLDPKTCTYEARISILQYLLVSLSTCSGMELLIRNNGLDVGALLDFVDSVLRYHVMHGHTHNLGDVTVAQYALLIFSRLVEISKGSHTSYCWKSVNESLRVLINLWRRFDSNFFVDADVTFSQQFVTPKSTMAKELWFNRAKIDYYLDMSDSLMERRLGLLRTMGSLYAILNAMCLNFRFVCAKDGLFSDDFLALLTYVSMNWDFMDALFPIVVYDSGFVDTYVKNDVTETNMRQFYRLGLWLGEDCLSPLSRCLHYFHDMKVEYQCLLMDNHSRGIGPMDIQALLRTIACRRLSGSNNRQVGLYSPDKLGSETFVSLLNDVMGPPESNGLDAIVPPEEDKSTSDKTSHDYAFYTFGTCSEFGYNYLMDVEKFRHFCVVLLTSPDEKANFLLSREMPNVRRCIELVPYIESLNDLKMRILSHLCELVDLYRTRGCNLSGRIDQLVTSETRVGDNGSMRMAKCSMQPFEMFAFNGTMLLQLALTRPECIAEHPAYVGLLFEFLRLVYDGGASLGSIENSFISYYECCGSSDVDDGGIVDYIVSRDQISTSDKGVVGQEFRHFAVNVYGGLVAQVARYIVEFSERYQEVLNVDLKSSTAGRTSLMVRATALRSCLNYQNRGSSSTGSGSVLSGFSGMGEQYVEQRDCVCSIASGKNIDIDNISVWLNFKMIRFFTHLYKLFSHAAKCGHEMEAQGEEEGALAIYERVTKYTVKSVSQCCRTIIGLLSKESEYLLQCFMDAGSGVRRDGGFESIYVFILGPYAISLALESIISTDFNREFLQDKGYMYMMDMAGSLAQLPYIASICISPSARSHMGDLLNCSAIMRQDRKYMADCMRRSEGSIFRYENHNWLRATLYKCLERMNGMMMYGVSSGPFMASLMASQLFQRIYLYSFLCHFVQPLHYVNPKTMLSKYSQNVCDGLNGDCIEVIENNITMWYPPYQGSFKGVLERCPYHRLHCGLLKFVVDACNSHVMEGSMCDADVNGGADLMSFVMAVLHLLRMRIHYVLNVGDLSLALLEECHVLFSLIRHISTWRRLSDTDVMFMKEVIQWCVSHFSSMINAFQNGFDKIEDHIIPQTVMESPDILRSRVNCTPSKVECPAESRHKASLPRSYQQRCLYLMLKNAESFLTFLMNLKFTQEYDTDIPPTMDKFLKTGDARNVKRMCAVDREGFLSLISGQARECFKIRPGDYQPPAYSHDMTFEVMTKAFNSCVEICVLALRLWKELRSSHKSAPLFGARVNGDVYIPLSLRVSGVGEYSTEVFGAIKCVIYKEVRVVPDSHVEVAPTSIALSDLLSLFECIIEKSVLFSAKVVNTAFVQNQLCQHEAPRNGGSISHWRSVPSDTTSGCPAEFHATLSLLNNAFSDIAVHASDFSKSTVDFCSMIETLVARRTDQAKLLSGVFHDSFVYVER
ncbi:hypothetical protein X943_000168 [Babesia divergens]|uniref:Uncharacterized protein n=1 Tax=Babesia divergens TaxID=32595 RepID=A0AAD9LFH9_BABDI|nr:hypothetical protein X943_000168 [Babesia divergens]